MIKTFLNFAKCWFLSYCIPKKGLTLALGYLAQTNSTRIKNFIIQWFIKAYQVNMKEALVENPKEYACFNDFFIRPLKPECRPLAKALVTSPVDGFISELGPLTDGQLVQAKGRFYTAEELLGDKSKALHFSKGQFATLYLSPKDYHRVHMPIDAKLTSMTYIPGSLFSVQPATTQRIPKLFARNERLCVHFDTAIGPMAMVLVGATIVGAIGTTWHGDIKRSKQSFSIQYNNIAFKQGEEMGYFKLGSTVILLFADGDRVKWDEMLLAGSAIRFGQALNH